jgi:hypothetical protein
MQRLPRLAGPQIGLDIRQTFCTCSHTLDPIQYIRRHEQPHSLCIAFGLRIVGCVLGCRQEPAQIWHVRSL